MMRARGSLLGGRRDNGNYSVDLIRDTTPTSGAVYPAVAIIPGGNEPYYDCIGTVYLTIRDLRYIRGMNPWSLFALVI